MATRRTKVLTVVAVLGCALVPAGVALVASGSSTGHDGLTVAGIVLGLAGLVCFRILSWARRIRGMTRTGLAFRVDPSHRRVHKSDERVHDRQWP